MARAVDAALGHRPRVPALDVFRGFAVMCMLVVHTGRIAHNGANNSAFRACLTWFEPSISVAFLWLVGWSLQRSYSSRVVAGGLLASQTGTAWRRWYLSCVFRAATLYAMGVALFLLQYGVQSPDLWASPDILSTIGWAILLVGMLLPLGTQGLLGGAVALLALLATVQIGGVDVSGVNAGPGATVPLVAIACVGACHGLTCNGEAERHATLSEKSQPEKSQVLWALGGVFCALSALGLPGRLVDQHASRYANGTVWFWNHTLSGIALYGGAVVAVATAFAPLGRIRPQMSLWEGAWAAPLSLLGRHALLTYVGHLLVLGAVDRWLSLHRHWLTFVTLSLGLLGAFMGIAMVVESKHARRAQQTLRQHLGLGRNSNG